MVTTCPLRILVADDHQTVRSAIAAALALENDFEVVGEAVDGWRAVEMVRHLRPDVVVMDVSMPGLSGLDATRRIVSSCPGTKVVGLSMHDGVTMASRMQEAGAATYVEKVAAQDRLIDAIRALRQP